MEGLIDLIQTNGVYLALPIIIAFLTQQLKTQVPFFKTILGLRLIHFLPLVLGLLGGLLLPEDTWQAKLLIGGGLGSLSLLLYKIVTVTLASKVKLQKKLASKTDLLDE